MRAIGKTHERKFSILCEVFLLFVYITWLGAVLWYYWVKLYATTVCSIRLSSRHRLQTRVYVLTRITKLIWGVSLTGVPVYFELLTISSKRSSQAKNNLGFFLKFLVDTCPFMGPLIPLFWTSGDIFSELFALGRGIRDLRSLRFTSGATPTDLWMASMVAGPFSPHAKKKV